MMLLFAIKDSVAKLVSGILFFLGRDYNVDDIVYIKGVKKARILRVGIVRTTFYMHATNRKLTVYNTKLGDLMIEKELPGHQPVVVEDKKQIITETITKKPEKRSMQSLVAEAIKIKNQPKIESKEKKSKDDKNTLSNWRKP